MLGKQEILFFLSAEGPRAAKRSALFNSAFITELPAARRRVECVRVFDLIGKLLHGFLVKYASLIVCKGSLCYINSD